MDMDCSSKQNEIERLQETNLQLKMENNNLRSKAVRYTYMKAPRYAVGNPSNSYSVSVVPIIRTPMRQSIVSALFTHFRCSVKFCARTVIWGGGGCKAGLHLNVIEGFDCGVLC